MVMPNRKQIQPVLLRVLYELAEPAEPSAVVPLVTRAFRELTEEDLELTRQDGRTSKWTNRVHWARQDLVYQNLVSNEERGVWKLTALGRQAAESVPSMAARIDLSGHELNEDSFVYEEPMSIDEVIRVLANPADQLADELIAAGHDSGNPGRLEEAIAAAMESLGYDAMLLGGSGRTDVLVSADIGPSRYRMVIDAKSSASGRVGEGQISWLTIDQHRKEEGADLACVVGPDFAGGSLRQRAEDFNVCLLKSDELANLVRLHWAKPVTLTELRRVFESSPLASDGIADVRAAADERWRRGNLLLFLLKTIDRFNRDMPDSMMAKPDVLWGAVATSLDDATKGATQTDVTASLELLEALGILVRANGDGYKPQTSLAGSLQVLGAYGRLAEADGGEQSDSSQPSLDSFGVAE